MQDDAARPPVASEQGPQQAIERCLTSRVVQIAVPFEQLVHQETVVFDEERCNLFIGDQLVHSRVVTGSMQQRVPKMECVLRRRIQVVRHLRCSGWDGPQFDIS